MKASILYLAFIFAVGLAGAAQAFSTTFAEYDDMTKDEQSTFISETGVTIYAWLKKNDPVKAQCMYNKFVVGRKTGVATESMTILESKIKGVPSEDRHNYHVESLMANYVIDNLCAEVNSEPTSNEQTKSALK